MKGSKLCEKDILLNITGASLGRCFYYDGNLVEANVNQHVCIIRLKHKISNYHYFRFCIISEVITEQISNSQTGSGREGLNFESIGNFSFPFPSIEEQNNIVQYIEKEALIINEIIALIKQEIELLKEYRQALIFEAVTGKIKVSD